MKRFLISVLIVVFYSSMNVFAQQDTITGFNFADSTDSDVLADIGLIGNMAFGLDAEDTNGTQRNVYYTNGATNFSATAQGWDGGLESKYWVIKFNADGYSGFKVSSKQSAGGSNPGPKYWKLQCKLEGGAWVDISPDTIVVANNWTSGVVTEWALPPAMDNPGSTAIYIRWIMASNQSISGSNVAANGIGKIDDIVVTGLSSVGMEALVYEGGLKCFPNPVDEILNVSASDEIAGISVFDLCGAKLLEECVKSSNAQVNLAGLAPGYYIVSVCFTNGSETVTRKLLLK